MVSLSSKVLDKEQEKPRIYDSFSLVGRLSMPFKAGNPSQFDYGNYLRNHNAYAVFYAKSINSLEKEQPFSAKILQKIK